jgi:replicative DNA helicase
MEQPPTSSISHRMPPQNKEAEQCVLGAVLQQKGMMAKAVDLITPDDFYLDKHKAIFKAMVTLFDRNEPKTWSR